MSTKRIWLSEYKTKWLKFCNWIFCPSCDMITYNKYLTARQGGDAWWIATVIIQNSIGQTNLLQGMWTARQDLTSTAQHLAESTARAESTGRHLARSTAQAELTVRVMSTVPHLAQSTAQAESTGRLEKPSRLTFSPSFISAPTITS